MQADKPQNTNVTDALSGNSMSEKPASTLAPRRLEQGGSLLLIYSSIVVPKLRPKLNPCPQSDLVRSSTMNTKVEAFKHAEQALVLANTIIMTKSIHGPIFLPILSSVKSSLAWKKREFQGLSSTLWKETLRRCGIRTTRRREILMDELRRLGMEYRCRETVSKWLHQC